MIKKFRYRMGVHVVSLLIVILIITIAIGINMFTEKSCFDVIYLICVLIAMFGILNNIFTYYVVEEKGLCLKSIVKQTIIEWDKIECIMKQPAGKFVSVSVGVFSSKKKISITPWTKDYKKLLQFVIDNVQTDSRLKIDPQVFSIIKSAS